MNAVTDLAAAGVLCILYSYQTTGRCQKGIRPFRPLQKPWTQSLTTLLKLEVIERDYRWTNEQLEAVLTEWLKMNYDMEEYELPSWRQLANAVEPIDCALAIATNEHHA